MQAARPCAPGLSNLISEFFNAEPKAKVVCRRSASCVAASYKAKISQAVFNGKFDSKKPLSNFPKPPDRELDKKYKQAKACKPFWFNFLSNSLEIFFTDDGKGDLKNPLLDKEKKLLNQFRQRLKK